MKVTVDMSNYETERESTEAEYGDEILLAGWNPEISTVCEQLQVVPTTEQPAMADVPSIEIVELFLRKIYSFQR